VTGLSGGQEHPLVGGRYRLEGDAPIGTGAMGEVWRATDTLLERVVALKRVRLTALDENVAQPREQMLSEGRIAARLHHPNVVTVFDVIVADDRLWLVLEYVPSRSASTLLAAEGPVSPMRAAQIGTQLADALAAAHAAGIWHRDVKPGNVLIDLDGRAKLTDFGISRTVNDLGMTGGGLIVGTPAYLAPEIARGEDFTAAADVYGLGATLYALVEGAPPFGSGDPSNPMRLVHRVATGAVPPPTRAGPLTGALTLLTDRDPGRRPAPAAARDLLAELAQGAATSAPTPPATGTPAPFPPPSPGPFPPASPGTFPPFPPAPAPPGARRRGSARPAVLGAVAALVAVVALAATLAVLTRGQPTPAAPPAAAPPTSAATPPTSTALASKYIHNPRLANPCGLLQPSDFAGFGSPVRYLGEGFHSCSVDTTLTGGGHANVEIYFFNYQQLYGTPEKHGDLTVYRSVPSATYCLRLVALPGRPTIAIPTVLTDSQIDPCQLSDIATETVLRILASGPVPELDSEGDANSLRRQDGCRLLDGDDLATVPGLNPNNVYPAFAGWGCTWGSLVGHPNFAPPAVDLYFGRTAPLSAGQDGTPEKIADRDVFVKLENTSDGQRKCVAQVVHRHAVDGLGGPLEEVVNIAVFAAAPDAQRCQLARTLAAGVVAKLPPQ
jgi:eukaryotic-like serine/threonine-protein kinase